MPHLSFQHDIQRQLSSQRFRQVKAIHANDVLRSTKCQQSVFGKADVADEQTSGPCGFLADLAMEAMQVLHGCGLVLPLCLDEIGMAVQHKTPVNLLAHQTKRAASIQSKRIE